MNNLELKVQAGSRFISSEMQELADRVVFVIPNWQWVTLIVGFVLIYFLRHVLLKILKKTRKSQPSPENPSFLHFLLELEIEKPISWIFAALGGMALTESLELTVNLNRYLEILFQLILSYNVIRLCYYATEAFGLLVKQRSAKTDSQIDSQLAPLATKSLKVIVIILGVLVVLQNFNVNVTALLAGLGIGGIAIAFAAQDTVANVFGTLTIILDKPFRMGERIKIGDTEGTVDEVGFRSTRIRTFYNSIVTIPNSVVAKERIDNLTERNGWYRFRQTIGFTYDANPNQLRQFGEHLKYLLLQDPKVDRDKIVIAFNGFGDSSLNNLINFHFHLDLSENEFEQTQIYLEMIYAVAQQLKLDFAFPTRTLIVESKVLPETGAATSRPVIS